MRLGSWNFGNSDFLCKFVTSNLFYFFKFFNSICNNGVGTPKTVD